MIDYSPLAILLHLINCTSRFIAILRKRSEKVMDVGAGGNRLVTCCSPVQVLTLLISLLPDAFGKLLLSWIMLLCLGKRGK